MTGCVPGEKRGDKGKIGAVPIKMKSAIKKLEGTARRIEVTLPSEKVAEVQGEVLTDIRKKVTISGFRKGKAPEDLVYKNYRKDVMDEVKRRLIPQAYEDALDEYKIVPVSFPEFSDTALDPKGALTFTARVDTQPEVKLYRYKGIKVTAEKVAVAEEEVGEALSRVRNMYAEFIETDTPLQKGDYGICSVEAFIDGGSISKKREKVWIEAGSETSMLGLGEGLCGMKKGEKKTMKARLPEGYPDKQFAGKNAEFNVEVKETKEKNLPELDDELAKKAGRETLTELREETRSQIMERKELNSRINMKNQIMEYLLKKHSFDLPESMVKRQLEILTKKAEDKPEGQLMAEARNRVKRYFILDEIARKEDISVTEEEVNDWLKSMAEFYNQKFEDVKKYYEENDLIGGVKERLAEDKTLDLLLSEAAVTVK